MRSLHSIKEKEEEKEKRGHIPPLIFEVPHVWEEIGKTNMVEIQIVPKKH